MRFVASSMKMVTWIPTFVIFRGHLTFVVISVPFRRQIHSFRVVLLLFFFFFYVWTWSKSVFSFTQESRPLMVLQPGEPLFFSVFSLKGAIFYPDFAVDSLYLGLQIFLQKQQQKNPIHQVCIPIVIMLQLNYRPWLLILEWFSMTQTLSYASWLTVSDVTKGVQSRPPPNMPWLRHVKNQYETYL